MEIKLNKPRETFQFQPPISIGGSWMIGLRSLEVYNSIFNIKLENNNFKLYKITDILNGVEHIYKTVGKIVEKKLGISNITQDLSDDETKRPIIIEKHRKTYQEINRSNPLINLLHRYLKFYISKI